MTSEPISSAIRFLALSLLFAAGLGFAGGTSSAVGASPAEHPSLAQALSLHQSAEAKCLTDAQLDQAAAMLDSSDPFIAALAEWALAVKVGMDNDRGNIVWPPSTQPGAKNQPAWFAKYMAVAESQRTVFDQIRHAAARNILDKPDALRADIGDMLTRAQKTSERMRPQTKTSVDAALMAIKAATGAAVGETDADRLRALWLNARAGARTVALAQKDLNFDTILCATRFALHHKSNVCGTQYNWAYKPGGDLCALSNFESGAATVKPLLAGKLGAGHIHGLDLSFEGDRVVFGWASQPNWPPKDANGQPVDVCHHQNNYAFELSKLTEPLHLYELDLKSASVTQLTKHHFFNDLDPSYLPDDGIVFASDRSGNSPSCDGWENDILDTNIFKLTPGRKTIRRVTNQKDMDSHPHVLGDGRIGYLRWEYDERGFWPVHSFWVVNPDGTQTDALYKQHLWNPPSVRDVRSIPGSAKFIGILAGHHCQAVGSLALIDASKGINEAAGMEIIARGSGPQEPSPAANQAPAFNWTRVPNGGVPETPGYYHTPWALSESACLVSFGFGSKPQHSPPHGKTDYISNDAALYFVDVFGNKELLHRDPLLCVVSAMPLAPRPRPTVLPDRSDPAKNFATCIVTDVYDRTQLVRGSVKEIRIMESLPWPLTSKDGTGYFEGGSAMNFVSPGWTPVRVIGTVPVESDGSAHFKVPMAENAAVYFQALDSNGMELQRMRSSVSFAPGEVRSCTGCHETRNNAAPVSRAHVAKAALRAPSEPMPPPWGNKPMDYPSLIQPILDTRCVQCHAGSKPAGGLSLAGGNKRHHRLDLLSSYFSLQKLVPCSNQAMQDGKVTVPKQFGSHASKLPGILADEKHRTSGLTVEELRTLYTWMDANCPYSGKIINKRRGCEDGKPVVPQVLSADRGGNPGREDFKWHGVWDKPVEVPAIERQ